MDKIESPCVGHCCLNENDICIGCLRDLQEIKQWGQASEARKKEIIVRISTQNTD